MKPSEGFAARPGSDVLGAGEVGILATNRRASSRRTPQRLSSESFFAQHHDLLVDLFGTLHHKPSHSLKELATGTLGSASPPSQFKAAVNQLKQTAFSRILKTAGGENSPEAFKWILELLIHTLGVETPLGVFTPMQKAGKPGRPISTESEKIYSWWVEMGQPSPYKNDLAKSFYGRLFNKANGTDRRKLRDKCRQAVDRHLEREIAELEKKLAEQRMENAKLREQLAQYDNDAR